MGGEWTPLPFTIPLVEAPKVVGVDFFLRHNTLGSTIYPKYVLTTLCQCCNREWNKKCQYWREESSWGSDLQWPFYTCKSWYDFQSLNYESTCVNQHVGSSVITPMLNGKFSNCFFLLFLISLTILENFNNMNYNSLGTDVCNRKVEYKWARSDSWSQAEQAEWIAIVNSTLMKMPPLQWVFSTWN